MLDTYINIAIATKRLLAKYSMNDLATWLGINLTHVYRARKHDYTPTYRKALCDKGILKRPAKRRRCVAYDVPEDFTKEMAQIYRADVQAYSILSARRVRALYNKEGE